MSKIFVKQVNMSGVRQRSTKMILRILREKRPRNRAIFRNPWPFGQQLWIMKVHRIQLFPSFRIFWPQEQPLRIKKELWNSEFLKNIYQRSVWNTYSGLQCWREGLLLTPWKHFQSRSSRCQSSSSWIFHHESSEIFDTSGFETHRLSDCRCSKSGLFNTSSPRRSST